MNTATNSVVSAGPESPASCGWVEAYGDYLFNFALGQVHDSSIAEDLVQETFLAAWKARDRFAGKSAERTWN
jgi:RNA polymerase sigma-70 factor (ECF subfamily)